MAKNYKVLVIGEGAVGKTSIATRYTTGAFKESHLMTLGANFMLKDVKMEEGETIRLSIWDTAGQEKFRKIVEAYYKSAKGVIITFDLTRRESFDGLEYWYNTTKEKVPDAKIMVAGNKADLDNHTVSKEEAEAKAASWGATYFETSAKFNQNINEIFMEMAKQLVNSN